jgi:anti-anti-sigma factor
MVMSRPPAGTMRNHAPLTVEVLEPTRAVALVRLVEELDADAAATLDDALATCLVQRSPCRLVLDLSRVELLCPEGLDLLLRPHRRCRVARTHLLLVGAGHDAVHRPLRVSGLLPLFDTRSTPESAIGGARAARVAPCNYFPDNRDTGRSAPGKQAR